jgi:hypothetical protein
MTYMQEVSTIRPGCLVLLVDQGAAMSAQWGTSSGLLKADGAAQAANDILFTLLLRSVVDLQQGPRHLYDVALLTYHDELVDAPLTQTGLMAVSDLDVHSLVTAGSERRPTWLRPYASGRALVGGAIDAAGKLIASWLREHRESFPPIVINIASRTEGHASADTVRSWAERLGSLGTSDGHVLLFNLVLSDTREVFFELPTEASSHNGLAMASSPLPPSFVEAAQLLGFSPGVNAIAYAECSSPVSLATAIEVALSPVRPGGPPPMAV